MIVCRQYEAYNLFLLTACFLITISIYWTISVIDIHNIILTIIITDIKFEQMYNTNST